ncbi:PREDICTED: 39S ribosomal protein L35, mitochondrial [Haliaeetus leucocephalus]|uniref:39S ribosomal protein L35, mitochondrial n=1 Tax=Haliaeetus leucocephalus TaxID=52644 RepID=UPI00053CD969|nr:PREDICTED: 39S ribosomal protein L35, mitochondrial [Haliaeetus leucocephalus]
MQMLPPAAAGGVSLNAGAAPVAHAREWTGRSEAAPGIAPPPGSWVAGPRGPPAAPARGALSPVSPAGASGWCGYRRPPRCGNRGCCGGTCRGEAPPRSSAGTGCAGRRSVTSLLPSILQQPVRTLTYCSLRNGKRKTVKAVIDRFLRLHNGLWVRRKAGYKKKLWKKSAAQRKRLRELVLCTRTQCKLLDKMTTSFWKRRNWYVNDPYQKYHDRTNLRV